jgi:hypothetical protein
VLKCSRLLAVLPILGRTWTAKVLATEALIGAAKAPTRGGEQMLESLVARRLIDLGSEWHLLRHRYEHSAWEIYLAKTMRWISLFGLTLRP